MEQGRRPMENKGRNGPASLRRGPKLLVALGKSKPVYWKLWGW